MLRHNSKGTSKLPLILVTNDDGVNSAGLRAAADAALDLGDVIIVAPNQPYSSVGRAMPLNTLWKHKEIDLSIRGIPLKTFAVWAYPSQIIHYAIEKGLVYKYPDLVISGINYGLNVGGTSAVSGTVGAALEAVDAYRIPALAVSVETSQTELQSQPADLDFRAATHFTCLFARKLLELNTKFVGNSLGDWDVLKVEVPSDATIETPWELTRVSKQRYWYPKAAQRRKLSDPGPIEWEVHVDAKSLEQDSDIAAVILRRNVAVSPLSSDMTSRVDLEDFYTFIRKTDT